MRTSSTKLISKSGALEAKAAASVVGKIIALEPALGPVIQLLTRMLQMDLADAVDRAGWSEKFEISIQAKEAISLLLESMDFFNGSPIKFTANAIPLRAILDRCSADTPVHGWNALTEKRIIASDASDKAVCAYSVMGLPDLYLQAEQEK